MLMALAVLPVSFVLAGFDILNVGTSRPVEALSSIASGCGFQPLKFRFGMFIVWLCEPTTIWNCLQLIIDGQPKAVTVVRQMDDGYMRGRGSRSLRRLAATGSCAYGTVVAMADSEIPGAHDVLLQPGLRVSFNAPFTTRQQTMVRLHNKSEKPIMWVVKSNLGKKITITPCSGVLEPNSAVNIHLVLLPFIYTKGPEERLTFETAVILPLMEKKFDQDFLQICEILNPLMKAIQGNFPNIRVQGCFFHFCQTVLRQVGRLGLKTDFC
ncbi:Major sperm protein 2 [Trichinella pseudospiralis]|uniref:Major sperm protein n=1 Tax=Trichinella pseudospiralis TaxID=6337 RepID=A0A0V1JDA8_TRIPS|nr:Major sperm protein 2 [Trichinella pseudospiralis]